MTLLPYGNDILQEFTWVFFSIQYILWKPILRNYYYYLNRISSRQLSNYSQEIVNLFPSENAIGYFCPFRWVNGLRKDPRGKLWEHYNEVKGILEDEGVLVRKTKRKNDEEQTVNLFSESTKIFLLLANTSFFNDLVIVCLFCSESDQEKLKLLETMSTPLSEVRVLWKSTFAVRRQILLKEQQSIHDYYGSFLGLHVQEGIHLVSTTFTI